MDKEQDMNAVAPWKRAPADEAPSFESPVELLRRNLDQLKAGDRSFAESLLTQHDAGKRPLSEKQVYWVGVLAERATPKAKAAAPGSERFQNILDLFEHAAFHKKFPKVWLQTADEEPVKLQRAGEMSRAPGSINVTDGGPFEANRWYGRISADGEWQPARRSYPESEAVLAVLREMNQDPQNVAMKYGRETGRCCFCAQELTDQRSIDAGYGPVCADKHGLEWG